MSVTRGAAHRLNERATVAEEALLIRIKNRHERDLRNVEALAKEVDAHEHVDLAHAQIANDIHAVERRSVRVHVVNLKSLVKEMVRKVLRHALCERRHQDALLRGNARTNLLRQVINLATDGAHVNQRIKQAGRADDLLDRLLANLLLVVSGCGRDIDELRHAALELIEAQGTVIKRARQAKSMFYQRNLARAVSFVHAADLRHRHVALVDDAEHVLGEIVDEREGRLARSTAVEVTRVVLDAVAISHVLKHLEVIARTLAQALSLEEFIGFLELGQALRKLLVDGVECAVDLGTLRDIVTCRPDGHRVKLAQNLARDLIDLGDNLDFIAKELDAERVLRIWRKHIHALPAHTEAAASKIDIVAVILDVY